MVKGKIVFTRVLPSLVLALALLQTAGPAIPQAQQKMDNLIVYGHDFMFGVKEPEGWQGDTEQASSFKMNILRFGTRYA